MVIFRGGLGRPSRDPKPTPPRSRCALRAGTPAAPLPDCSKEPWFCWRSCGGVHIFIFKCKKTCHPCLVCCDMSPPPGSHPISSPPPAPSLSRGLGRAPAARRLQEEIPAITAVEQVNAEKPGLPLTPENVEQVRLGEGGDCSVGTTPVSCCIPQIRGKGPADALPRFV